MKLLDSFEKFINKHFFVIFGICVFIPFVFAIKTIITGQIAFWYDPARDLLLAWDNLSKLTLIGPPSGIPGIFYGPYWIWLLSVGLFFSKDPRIVDFVTNTLPYFIFFPLCLLLLSKILNRITIITIWLLFILGFSGYPIQIWSPNPFPLYLFEITVLLLRTDFSSIHTKEWIKILIIGFFAGVAMQFQISFGTGMLVGIPLFLLFGIGFGQNEKIAIKNRIFFVVMYAIGLGISLLPMLLFEVRHGFQQTHTLFQALTTPHAVVGLTGLTKQLIIQRFFERFGLLLELPLWVATVVVGTILSYAALAKKKIIEKKEDNYLFLLPIAIATGVLSVYLTTKNPVWDYHFIGAEILFLLITAVLINRLLYFRSIFFLWAFILLCFHTVQFTNTLHEPMYATESLASKLYITDIILSDGKTANYTVFAYYQAIYTYDFDYLFKEKANRSIGHTPKDISKDTKYVYLIIPEASKKNNDGFIYYITPKKEYKTDYIWRIPDGTIVMKRLRINK